MSIRSLSSEHLKFFTHLDLEDSFFLSSATQQLEELSLREDDEIDEVLSGNREEAVEALVNDSKELLNQLIQSIYDIAVEIDYPSQIEKLQRVKKALFSQNPTEEPEELQESFKEIFIILALSNWFRASEESTIFVDFDLDIEEKVQLLKEVVEIKENVTLNNIKRNRSLLRNLKYLDLPLSHRIDLAKTFIKAGYSITSSLPNFGIESEVDKKELLIEELSSEAIPRDNVSHQFDQLGITQLSDRIEIACLAARKGISVAEHIHQYNITDEDVIYQIFSKCTELKNDKLLLFVKDISLPFEQRLDIIKRVANNSLDGAFLSYLKELSVPSDIILQILTSVAEANPTILYNSWNTIKELVDSNLLMILKEKIPFFKIEERMNSLQGKIYHSFSSCHSELEAILHELHELNKRASIPLQLAPLIHTIVSESSDQEILDLMHMLNEYFYSETFFLFSEICEEAIERAPLFKTYVNMNEIDEIGSLPLISSQGVFHTLQEKIKKKGISDVFFPPAFYIDSLQKMVMDFYSTKKAKGIFIICFSESMNGHLSPLFIEREGRKLKILNSDSVYSGGAEFTEEILEQLGELPYQMELYVLPQKRQNDDFSCRTFTITDSSYAIKTYSEGNSSFIDNIKKESQIEVTTIKSLQVNKLLRPPIPMLKILQSMKKIKELGETTLLRKGQLISLREYVKDHSFFVEAVENGSIIYKAVNTTAQRKACKYLEQLFEYALKSCK